MELVISRYEPYFELGVQSFLGKAFKDDGRELDLKGKDKDLTTITSHYMNAGGCFWVLKDDKNIVHGTIALRYLGDCFEIRRFFVGRKDQGKGYGKLLLQTVLQYAIDTRVEIVKAATLERSMVAQFLFEQAGFKPAARYNESRADIFYKLALTLEWRYIFQINDLRRQFHETLILNPTENLPCLHKEANASFIDGLYVSERIKDLSDKIIFAGRNPYISFFASIKNSWCQLLHAYDVDLKTLSGLHAHMILFMCILHPKDIVMLLPEICGGHYSTEAILKSIGADVIHMQADCRHMCVDREKTEKLIELYQPKYIFVDRSEGLVYEDFSWLGKYEQSFKIFDASQYLSHILTGDFQNPFAMGFDMILSTLHKNYPGPQKGIICVKKDSETWRTYQQNAKTFLSSTHPGDIVNSLQPLLEFEQFKEYARNNNVCSRLLEKELVRHGIPVVEPACTDPKTMHTWILCQNSQESYDYYLKLEQLGLLTNYRLLPYDLGYGLRLGTSAAIRCGLNRSHIAELAGIMSQAYHGYVDISLKKRTSKFIRKVKEFTA